MKCKILHESGGRLRVHMCMPRMTMAQADHLEYYLKRVKGVRKVHVSERTADATVIFLPKYRDDVISAFACYSADDSTVAVPEHSGREIKREYEDKLFYHIAKSCVKRLVLPVNLKNIWTVIRSVPYIVSGVRCILKGKLEVPVLDMASICVSMLQGNFRTAADVMFLLGIGDIIEEWTHKKSLNDLASAMSLKIDKVWLRTDGGEILTPLDAVSENDIIVIRAGSQIPLDGIVADGEAVVNQASITGEPLAVAKSEGSYVYAGTVVENGEIAVSVKKVSGEGRYDRIVKMIEKTEKLKSEAESKASHLADRLVPYTFGGALLTYLLTRNVTRATGVLMVDFCCALKLSMPIAVLSAMREAEDHHISVKGGKFLEAVAEAKTIVFDKTGTLTYAEPKVAKIVPFAGHEETEILRLAACLEEHFPHSIANAVVCEAERRGIVHEERHGTVEYVVAHGIASSIDGNKVIIGSSHFVFEDEKCVVPDDEQEKFDTLPPEYSHLYLAEDGVLIGVLLIEDPLREDAARTIKELRKCGFERIVMMTGDSDRTAKAVAEKVGVDEYYSEVLPEDKAAFVDREHLAGRKVIMIGDGVNDSPALSAADAGIAISSGAAIAREIADITVSGDDLENLVLLKKLACLLMERIHGNYRKILTFNTALILLGAAGVLSPTVTALLHNSSTIAIGVKNTADLLDE